MNCQEQEWRAMLADYALGMLPVPQAERVAFHLATCESCRSAVLKERALAQEVRAAVHTLSQPAPARLRALMPAAPQRHTGQLLLWRPVAALALLAVLFLGSLQMNQSRAAYSLPTASTTRVVATATHVPTAGSTETPQISALQPPEPMTQVPVLRPPAAPPRPAHRP